MRCLTILLLICMGSYGANQRPTTNKVKITEINTQENCLNFQEFWSRLRESVLKNDTLQLVELCHFPVIIKGDQDDEPVVKINRNHFSACFELFLRREVNKKGEHITNFNFIKETQIADDSFGYQETKTWRRVGDIEFEIINNGWKLMLFYYPKESLNKNLPFFLKD